MGLYIQLFIFLVLMFVCTLIYGRFFAKEKEPAKKRRFRLSVVMLVVIVIVLILYASIWLWGALTMEIPW